MDYIGYLLALELILELFEFVGIVDIDMVVGMVVGIEIVGMVVDTYYYSI